MAVAWCTPFKQLPLYEHSMTNASEAIAWFDYKRASHYELFNVDVIFFAGRLDFPFLVEAGWDGEVGVYVY